MSNKTVYMRKTDFSKILPGSKRKKMADFIQAHGLDMKEVSVFLRKNHAYIRKFLFLGTPQEIDFEDYAKLSDKYRVPLETFGIKPSLIKAVDQSLPDDDALIEEIADIVDGVMRERGISASPRSFMRIAIEVTRLVKKSIRDGFPLDKRDIRGAAIAEIGRACNQGQE